jgi:hypothetical protein
MRRVVRLRPVHANRLPTRDSFNGLEEYEMHQDLAGYVLELPSAPQPPDTARVWSYVIVVARPLGEPDVGMALPMPPSSRGAHPTPLHLRPVGRLVPMAAPQPTRETTIAPPKSEPRTPPTVHVLRPVRSGGAYSVPSQPTHRLVRPELAEALETVFERFARERGFSSEKPLEIRFSRGFKAGSHGHGEGRAADIAAVGGKSLLAWKQEWDQAIAAADKLSDAQQRAKATAAEQQRNLGYALYKALQDHNSWRVNQGGWRPYRGVMQLFGPWTATEGPWKAMQIKDPDPHQRQRLADQQWVFRAHQDHIHVAR